ncbi:GntR family transcriptional regulator [Streptomyces abyssalis]|uniref:GntR family transcriptional regulator n=1 Tax=Streptomyces abyssalis TaxID=933944 RepID=A0A1E7JUH7_9ACTN|nr:FCD domain-containing protein [Streptomyces abyssalis]OEU89423.1 GntR family transcriptional regulator [Streptomyces abyssalis]OEU93607.1 GntR family transcriptional regulator [Streptomyces abyssalis]OEV30098.1 GntR family transcriptional regulator [Streptomyces nanshensis]
MRADHGTGLGGPGGRPENDRLAAVLRPVRAGNGFEEALEQILQIVRLGLVPDGERLPAERELAERLGISRVMLREVLKVLAEQGLVTSRRGRYGGTFVRHPQPPAPDAETAEDLRRSVAGAAGDAEVRDTLRFREVLETGAAELCASRGLERAEAARLRAALDATRNAALSDYRRSDTLLHLTLVELAGSPTLTAQYAAVRAKVNDLLGRIPLLVRNLEHAQQQHAELVDAVLSGDPDRARSVSREHCAGTAALLRGFLT